ncbi:MAG: glycosyltransferase [Oscillospiraceae bacterium]|nr:glycosyltransferase [Oscillospiraceae bacterium]
MGGGPLRILYTASTAEHLRSFHLPYLAALRDRGHAVTAAARGDGRGLPAGVAFFPADFTKKMFSPRNLGCAIRLSRLIRREKFDVIVTHTSLAAFFTRLGVLLAGKGSARVVNTVHGYLFDDDTPPLRRRLLLTAEKLMAGVTDDLLVMNAYDERLAREHRLCRGRVARIDGMGVPLNRYRPADASERREARSALELPEDGFVLLCAAEFSPRKNQSELIRAAARLPEDTILLLPGDGALLEECRALAAASGAADRIRFPGRLEDLTAYYHAADVYVSASRSEGLPFSVMEAMGCALPCLLSRVKGHEDLLGHGRAGLLFPPGDGAALPAGAEKLREDPVLRRAMGEAGREAVERYSLDKVLPAVLPWFEHGPEG